MGSGQVRESELPARLIEQEQTPARKTDEKIGSVPILCLLFLTSGTISGCFPGCWQCITIRFNSLLHILFGFFLKYLLFFIGFWFINLS